MSQKAHPDYACLEAYQVSAKEEDTVWTDTVLSEKALPNPEKFAMIV
ncbi:hypothetical protein [Allocoleopsis sp.]